MAGTLFVVCVPTKEHEAQILDLGGTSKQTGNSSKLQQQNQGNANLLGVRLGARSKSEDSLFARDAQDDGVSARKEMFIGPWRVDASDLPRTPAGTPRSAHTSPGRAPRPRPRSPLLDHTNISRSDPEGLSARPTATPSSRRRRHRFLEMELENVLNQLKINNAVWCMGRNNRYVQVLFSVESGNPCEEALHKLAETGIGVMLDSVVSVLPCVLYYQGSEKSGNGSMDDLQADVADKKKDEECPGGAAGPGGRGRGEQPGTWDRFVQSVRARLTVAQVVEGVRANAVFTFDFLLLLIVAALVAALGLFEDSTVILVASMLISPLMGPVMAATFGTMIRDRDLQRMGLVNECVGLFLCLLIGFVTGVGVSLLDRPWPTEEMLDRGLLRSLWVNVLIAVLSGMGIAIALLRDNTGSLVGVAISASLLPPAVNAGLLWGMSLAYAMTGASADRGGAKYSANYSSRPEMEMAIMGGVSLCITLINIIFIYITGILMLKVKEVAPASQVNQRFWQHDVKIARDYNTTLYGASAADILRSVVGQDKCGSAVADGADGEGRSETPLAPGLARLLQLSSALPPHFGGAGDPHYLDACQQQLTWSPSTLAPCFDFRPDTVRELAGLYYHTLQQQSQHAQGRRSSLSTCAPPLPPPAPSYPAWRLGSSDGYRCHPRKRRAGSPPAAPRAPPAVCTPPFNNMACNLSLATATPASSLPAAAFKTPKGGSTYVNVPTTPSLFLTPIEHTPAAVRDVPILSVNNETAPGWQADADAATAHRPTKKRRFIVTKAEDKEMLLPRQ